MPGHFDPQVLEAFRELSAEFEKIHDKHQE